MAIENTKQQLRVSAAQFSSAGVKPQNEDSMAIKIPDGSLLNRKGIVVAIADGVSAAEAGREASEIAITGFVNDYYSTPDSWSVKQSAHKVLTALNRWLFGQGQRYLEAEKGYVTTFSCVILKSRSAYIFHVGDSRVWRLREGTLEQMTRDHTARISASQSYLSRALGIDLNLDVDLKVVDIEPGDCFLLTTDGVHEFLSQRELLQTLQAQGDNLQAAVETLVQQALDNQSTDNLTCQLVQVEQLGQETNEDVLQTLRQLPFPPELEVGFKLDGWCVLEQIHASQRSQLYRVRHEVSGQVAVMKTPSVNYVDNVAYIERFIMEEWVGRRIDSPYVVKVVDAGPSRRFLYYLTEDLPGPTLAKLLQQQHTLDVPAVVGLAEKLVQGLRAFHRRETLHQDIKPDNIVMKGDDPVIIDFGSVYVAGVDEIATSFEREHALGTLDYSAPEYRLQRPRSERSDQFSLAVVLYELLTGKHPFGEAFQKAGTAAEFLDLKYTPAYRRNPMVPLWLDGALRKALQTNAELRYDSLSEWVHDLKHPNPAFLKVEQRPLLERDPARFWRWVALTLLVTNLLTLGLWLK
ncbi:MAG: bifunctional protein-serine/threonine kinase/phosphatase [Pseudomonadota bacterium]|nr:bifunctional protein-serine/threonine kinase/phosphatase [Pseudomonadota bacterium]